MIIEQTSFKVVETPDMNTCKLPFRGTRTQVVVLMRIRNLSSLIINLESCCLSLSLLNYLLITCIELQAGPCKGSGTLLMRLTVNGTL